MSSNKRQEAQGAAMVPGAHDNALEFGAARAQHHLFRFG